ncbi:hypothetical protein TRVL_07883 [Trypanosoma vivax]|nr:hypothetical protein TRVL_07883 [Trypanosoma vivax]
MVEATEVAKVLEEPIPWLLQKVNIDTGKGIRRQLFVHIVEGEERRQTQRGTDKDNAFINNNAAYSWQSNPKARAPVTVIEDEKATGRQEPNAHVVNGLV